jgi:hypothetical protein
VFRRVRVRARFSRLDEHALAVRGFGRKRYGSVQMLEKLFRRRRDVGAIELGEREIRIE